MKSIHWKLRPLKLGDKKTLASLANNKNIWINVRDHFPYPYTENDAHKFIERTMNNKDDCFFGIETEGGLSGVCAILKMQDVHLMTGEIGYWIGEKYWYQGIATWAVKELIHFAWNRSNLRRLQASVFSYNQASMKVLERNGFELEGILKGHVFKNSVFCDEHIFGLQKT